MTSLIVTLPLPGAPAATEYSYVLTPDGRTLGAHASAPVALLPQPSRSGGEVVVVVPARALSWHRVELPKGSTSSASRLRAVLDGMLEERLLDEPETLHFALEPGARAGAAAWVAACDRTWLRAAVQALESAGRPVARIVPEYEPDAAGFDAELPPRLHVIGDPQDAWLVTTHPKGVVVLPLSPSALSLPLASADDVAAGATVTAEPGVAALAEQVLQTKVQIRQQAQAALDAAQSRWDLAQFDLASSGRSRAIKRLGSGWRELLGAPQWRAARWGAVVLLLANLAGLNVWAWKEQRALESKRDGVRSALTQTFPGVKVVVDAPLQMERELALLRQATGATSGRDLEAMLAALAAVLPPSRSLSSIDYAAGEARLKTFDLGAAESASLTDALRAQGYAARLDTNDTLVVRADAGAGAAR